MQEVKELHAKRAEKMAAEKAAFLENIKEPLEQCEGCMVLAIDKNGSLLTMGFQGGVNDIHMVGAMSIATHMKLSQICAGSNPQEPTT